MYRLAIITIMAITPATSLAVDHSTNTFEMDCRTEMNLVGIDLQPGTQTRDLRLCIRKKAREARSLGIGHMQPTTDEQRAAALKEKQSERFEQAIESSDELRMRYNRECREKLGIEAVETVRPGLLLGKLNRCMRLTRSQESRALKARSRSRQGEVYQRTKQIGKSLKDRKKEDLHEDIRRLYNQRRTRVEQTEKADFNTFKQRRDSTRTRGRYYFYERVDRKAENKRRADLCRNVIATEWGNCIREAIDSE